MATYINPNSTPALYRDDVLRFTSKNNWTINQPGLYRIKAYGAGASQGGRGGLAEGEIYLEPGDQLSFIIGSQSGGGSGGIAYYVNYSSAYSGGNGLAGASGTRISINNTLVLVGGGGGGRGGLGSAGTSYGGSGGSGGHGGGNGQAGGYGATGCNSGGGTGRSGGAGGSPPSSGGLGGLDYQRNGNSGPTAYDGGGGGAGGRGSAGYYQTGGGGGGGGAGGINFVHSSLLNSRNGNGINSGSGYIELLVLLAPPKISQPNVSNLGRSSVTVSSYIDLDNINPATEYGFVWSTNPSPEVAISDSVNLGYLEKTSSFYHDITGLKPNTHYYVRGYGINEEGIGYSDEISFVTHSIPLISGLKIEEVDGKLVAVNSTLETQGGTEVFDKGVVASTSPSPTINDLKFRSLDESDSYSTLLSLQPVTQYYVRPYASNKYGTGYGGEIVVTTTHKPEINSFKISPDDPIRSDITVTANLSEEIGQKVKYRILVNGQPYLDWTNLRTTPYNVSDVIPFSFSVFQLENNSITIEVENEDGLQRSQTIEFYVPFKEPELDSRSERDTYFRFAISDHYGDKVRYRTFINDAVHADWSSWSSPGVEYTVSWDSSQLAIGNHNTFRIEWENEAPTGEIHSHEYTFSGQYRSLIFLGPDNVVFSDDLGNVLEMLDLGEPYMGTTSDVVKVTLQNTLEFPITNITIYAAPETTAKDSIHLLSWDNPDGELDFRHRIYYNDVLMPYDTITLYVKAEVGEFDNTHREFGIYGYGMQTKVDATIESTTAKSFTENIQPTSFGSTTGKQVIIMSRFEPANTKASLDTPSKNIIQYEYVEMGALYYSGVPLNLPTRPWLESVRVDGKYGNIPRFHGNIDLYEFGAPKNIRTTLKWHKFIDGEHKKIIYICDRNLIVNVSWDMLWRAGFAHGKTVVIEDREYLCRLFETNEWSRYIINGTHTGQPRFKSAPIPSDEELKRSSLSKIPEAIMSPHNQAWWWNSLLSWGVWGESSAHVNREMRGDQYPEYRILRNRGVANIDLGWRPVLIKL